MLTRRNFIEQIAATGGVSLAYDSHAWPGPARGGRVGPLQPARHGGGRAGGRHRRRPGRAHRGLRAREARLHHPCARGAAASRWPRRHHPAWHGQRGRGLDADLRFRRGSVLQSRADAHRLPPRHDPGLLPRAGRAARGVRGQRRQRVLLSHQGHGPHQSPRAHARGARRHRRLRQRAAQQSHRAERARRRAHQGRSPASARLPAGQGPAHRPGQVHRQRPDARSR